ncbi:hypothetical protein CR513_00178, partial [Mucuna pruriens]
MCDSNSQKWIDAMKYEMKSMLWIFKTKKDSNDNIEIYKKEGIDNKETFSLTSLKDSFSTIIALVAHFDLVPSDGC